jgi:hypothetical protein
VHPLIARFLDPAAARDVLDREAQGLALDAEQAAFAVAARGDAKLTASLRARSVSPDGQQRAIVAAVRAATALVLDDAELGPPARLALEALRAQGASETEARALVSQAVLEEAFGYAEDPARFDRPFLRETLERLPALAAIDQGAIDDWLELWAREGAPEARALRLAVAEILLEAAWSDGPQPITPEHLDDALGRLEDTVAERDLHEALALVAQLLAFLDQRGVVGPQRLERLTSLVHHFGPTSAGDAEADDEDGA